MQNAKYVVWNNRGVQMRVFDTKTEAEEYSDYINDMERDICTWVEAEDDPVEHDMHGRGWLYG